MSGHLKVSNGRAPGYERELALSGQVQGLLIRGRADGFDPTRGCLEEIKTHRGDASRIPDNHRHLHWAQAKVYGALLCRTRGFAELELALVYFNIDDETETVAQAYFAADALFEFVDALALRYRRWAEQEASHRLARNAAIGGFAFPHVEFNAGQRALAKAVYRASKESTALLVQAPTGIGKTVGTLFPALKACDRVAIDKLYFLTAKSPGRQVALDALALIQGSEKSLRVLELVSREKSCVYPDRRCNGESCPLARGFYDRLPMARAAAAVTPLLDQTGLRGIAAAHEVCPYYLGQEMIRWSDVIVGDYNYYFDSHAILFGLMIAHEWNVTILVDEAHNLVDRARDMYSASIDSRSLHAARRPVDPGLRRSLTRLQQALSDIAEEQTEPYEILEAVPERLSLALSDFLSTASALQGNTGEELPPDVQECFFNALAFKRLADSFGLHSMVDATLDHTSRTGASRGTTLCIRNIIPAPFVGPRLAAAHGVALFSATLNPPGFYRDLLGLPEATPWLDVPSPFAADQLRVRIASQVSTRYAERDDSIDPIVTVISAQFRKEQGNYLAFFSSFDYLEQTVERLRRTHPDVPVWTQSRRMDERARTEFLDRFRHDGAGIGFAVLGGVFSEGIDLPGRRLIGAFVVTLGIPQVNPVNEAMATRMTELFGTGCEYTYLYPGLRKVVQAAGRVIRHREDRGTIVLLDRRYARPEIKALLPAWWQL